MVWWLSAIFCIQHGGWTQAFLEKYMNKIINLYLPTVWSLVCLVRTGLLTWWGASVILWDSSKEPKLTTKVQYYSNQNNFFIFLWVGWAQHKKHQKYQASWIFLFPVLIMYEIILIPKIVSFEFYDAYHLSLCCLHQLPQN